MTDKAVLLAMAVLLAATQSGSGSGSGSAARIGSDARSATGPGPASQPDWVTVPTGWRPLAELVPLPSPRGRLPDAVRVDARRAYGDPANGCFALLQRVSAPARGFDEARARAALRQQLQSANFTANPGTAELSFLGHGVQGRMRGTSAREVGERIAFLSVACFYNHREPDRCRPACDAMLDSAGAMR